MKTVFVDTVYWVAMANPRDSWKSAAEQACTSLGPALMVTTDEILTEFLAAMSRWGPESRRKASRTVRAILANPNIKVVAQSRDTFLRALDRYEHREDKSYSLTDCSSMNTMDAEGVREILTRDHHFEQESYTVLMKDQGSS
jgi:predicted nucleic acid-binding protein